MIYKEISEEDYWDLQDQTGAYLVLYSGGTKEWYLNGKRHREDGPAIEGADGDNYWYLHGVPHREDGPAIEYSEEDKEWYLHGERHREDGPAVEWGDGDKEWYLHGKRMKPKRNGHLPYMNSRSKRLKIWLCDEKIV